MSPPATARAASKSTRSRFRKSNTNPPGRLNRPRNVEDAAWFPKYSGGYQIERLKEPFSAEPYPALHVFDVGRNKLACHVDGAGFARRSRTADTGNSSYRGL